MTIDLPRVLTAPLRLPVSLLQRVDAYIEESSELSAREGLRQTQQMRRAWNALHLADAHPKKRPTTPR